MSVTGPGPVCDRCGAPLRPGSTPGGLCPACLLKLGLEGEPTELLDVTSEPRPDPEPDRAPPLGQPERVGPYRVVRLLGEGGMGAVYLAEQEGALRRRVAVKVIKLGMDTREVVARFEGERQMLAMMSHPSIARVFEAGATEGGRPYFVMEYVEGERITDYCDHEALTVPARLELFLRVCGAVQHAHQKGVIHRDLKPSNVLVEATEGGDPTPKVIDFGVAKATGPGSADRTLLTRFGAWIGTPAYMSPEAAWGTALEADSRTDIYALGVLLYELLCGTLPFDPDRLHRATEEELRQILRQEDPPPPSQRLAALGDAEAVARLRGTDASSLGRRLRGDLDWIVMQAMEKDRDRRYPSVSELAADLLRHLRHQPVSAGPPSAGYRLGKLVRRHRVAVAAAGGVALTLLLGIAGTTVGLLQARAAERTARQEARTAEAVSDFLVGLFEVSDPGEARGNTITAREILDDGAERIRTELEEEPGVQARLLGTMGTVYRKLGLYDEASALLEDSVRIQEQRTGADTEALARSLKDLGTLEVELGRFERGQELLERALATLRAAPEADEPGLAQVLKELAVLFANKGEPERAELLYRESLELAQRVLGPRDPLVAWVLNDLGNLAQDREEYEEAEALFRRSLEIHEALYGPVHPYVANNLNNLANSYQYRGAFEQALPLRERAQEIYEAVLGPDHRLYSIGLANLALLHQELGDYPEAEALHEEALESRERALGPDHPEVAVVLHNLAGLYRDRGLYDRAEPLYERALGVAETALGPESNVVGVVLHGFAGLHRARGDLEASERLQRRALGVLETAYGPEHSRVTTARAALADLRAQRGDPTEAAALFERAAGVQRALLEGDPDNRLRRADLATTLLGRGRLHQARGEPDAARRSWSEALDLMAPVAAESEAVELRHLHAMALLHLGRGDEARSDVEELLATGWRDPELLELARAEGIL